MSTGGNPPIPTNPVAPLTKGHFSGKMEEIRERVRFLFCSIMKYITFSVFVLLACLVVIFRTSGDEASQQPVKPQFPIGKNIGHVEFDCTIELAAPVSKKHHIFFMRYQVSPKTISYDIQWAEPAWLHVDFPYPPFGLSMYADDSLFVVYSSWNDKRWEHCRPEPYPVVFSYTCGNYSIDEQRHFLSESLLARLFVNDIKTIANEKTAFDTRGVNGLVRAGNPVDNSSTRRGLLTGSFGFSPDNLQFSVDLEYPKEYKELSYRFSDNRLERLAGHLRERIVPVGGFEIHAKTNDLPKGITITQLPVKYHEGDREFKTLFTDVEIGMQNVTLPQKIEVRSSKVEKIETNENGSVKEIVRFERAFIRRATLSNYRHVEKMTTPKNMGAFFSGAPHFEEEQKFRKLSIEYWLKKPENVPDEQLQWFRDFADQCLERYAVEKSLSDRLRLLHMAIISDLHTGNIERVETETFPKHFSELTDSGFPHIASDSAEQFLNLCGQWGISVQLCQIESVSASE